MYNFSPAIIASLELANNNDKVRAYFGVPIKRVLFSSGSLSYRENHVKIVRAHIKVKGPKNTGYLIVDAKKIAGYWVPSTLAIENLDHEILLIIGTVNSDITFDDD